MKSIFVLGLLTLFVAACSQTENETSVQSSADEPTAQEANVDIYKAAVENAARTDNDRARDVGRHPAEVMAFFGIDRGMHVLDMFSGGGYYSELLSYVVGDGGRVTAHSNEAYANYVVDEVVPRFANDRLPNVEIMMAENNELSLQSEQFDAVMLILSYHDIYYVDAKNGWPKIDGAAMLAEIFNGLKPGGVVGIVDHRAAAGAPRETGNTLHRIDPEIVIEEMTAAGFVLDGKSNMLQNLEDDHSVSMSDPSVRSKTDRFVLRFSKPTQ